MTTYFSSVLWVFPRFLSWFILYLNTDVEVPQASVGGSIFFFYIFSLRYLICYFGFTTIAILMTIKGTPPARATSGLGFRYPYPAAYLTFPLGQPVFVSCLFCPKHKSSTFSLQACAILPNIPHLSNWPRSIVQIKESRNVLHSPVLSYLRFSSSSQQVPLVLLPKFSEIPLIFTS